MWCQLFIPRCWTRDNNSTPSPCWTISKIDARLLGSFNCALTLMPYPLMTPCPATSPMQKQGVSLTACYEFFSWGFICLGIYAYVAHFSPGRLWSETPLLMQQLEWGSCHGHVKVVNCSLFPLFSFPLIFVDPISLIIFSPQIWASTVFWEIWASSVFQISKISSIFFSTMFTGSFNFFDF